MSFCILSSKTVFSTNPQRATPRRRFCHASTASPPPQQQQQLQIHLQKLGNAVIPSVVVLESHFSSPSNSFDIHDWPRTGTGFFVEPTLIVTSMHVVARAAPSHDSNLHKASIARTIAFTREGAALHTRPLAVSFARDVAVLEVVQMQPAPPRRCCKLAESPPDPDSILVAIARHQSLGLAMMVGKVRAAEGERSITGATPPWPLDDEIGWVEHGWVGMGVSDPAPGSSGLCDASVTRIMGSPWFNLGGEVVGVSSWQVTDKSNKFSVGFAAPNSSIEAVVDYAKTKGGDDPLVMDRWIDDHLIFGD